MRHDKLGAEMVFISKSNSALVSNLMKIDILTFSSQDPNCAVSKTILNFFHCITKLQASFDNMQNVSAITQVFHEIAWGAHNLPDFTIEFLAKIARTFTVVKQ
ncbi:MAG: hypothetical protein GY820_42555 [Gammaproteobacteria bacterium]|nr:hypothetical protein [Gammaproteobacteria bacterium]